VTSIAGSFANALPGGIAMNYGASKAALNKYMTLLAVQKKPQGVIVALVEPIFVASKSDPRHMKGAAPVDQEVGKLVKVNRRDDDGGNRENQELQHRQDRWVLSGVRSG